MFNYALARTLIGRRNVETVRCRACEKPLGRNGLTAKKVDGALYCSNCVDAGLKAQIKRKKDIAKMGV
ncbi:MAG: hypothetical protein ACTSW1_08360 [Candidatus Hodarchaeales archaeon]